MEDDIWNSFFGDSFEAMNKRIESLFSNAKSFGPEFKTYGYTMYQGPDGKQYFREFGDPDLNLIGKGQSLEYSKEPLTDVTQEDGIVRAIAEIPGVSKDDIMLECTKNTLSISVNTDDKKYSKTLALPCNVTIDSAKAEYNNGLLEVTFDIEDSNETRKKIHVH